MNKHLKQTFEINFLKIGIIANAGVIQIGCGSGVKPRLPHAGYTQIGTSLVHLTAISPSVPLASPVGRN
ncbi:spore germination protein GerPB [Neobacillus sp. NPDC097160]|uniref:spore germination protein GerPB n=1 Tax=Neobacillus sp. NPDC097160 TaxID=3364298 RepID=UPI00382B89AC